MESLTKTRSHLIGAWLGADLGTSTMNDQLRIVTIRIAHVEDGGVRAWSDDLAGLSLTCPNHEVLFAELPSKIATLLEQQGFRSKIVREIHQFVVEVSAETADGPDQLTPHKSNCPEKDGEHDAESD